MQKTTIKPAGRWQVTLPKNTALDNRINSLLKRYEGVNLTEITKLALIELDKKNRRTTQNRQSFRQLLRWKAENY